jgi:putative transcriptional regulator
MFMDFEWDEQKSETAFRERGFDFDFAIGICAGPIIEIEDVRKDYGETRIKAIGETHGFHSSHHLGSTGQQEGAHIMAIVRRSLEKARSAARFDSAKIEATTEDDIRRHRIEDGEDPGIEPSSGELVLPPKAIREKLGMTQDQFSRALRIPLATLRNWEQNRVLPDPAARSLLNIVAKEPKAALRALRMA